VASRLAWPLVRELRRILETDSVDVVQCEYAFMALNFLRAVGGSGGVPAVLTFHDFGDEALRTLAWRHPRWSPRFVAYRVEAFRKAHFDHWLLRHRSFGSYLFVSSDDRRRAALEFPQVANRLRFLPIGLPRASLAPPDRAPNQSPAGDGSREILFTGSFADESNLDSVIWFCRKVLPQLPGELRAHLSIVGRHADRVRRYIRDERILVAADVPDTLPYFHRAAVVVAPVFAGGGVRVKVLEALAAGRLVVGSEKAFRGTNLVPGTHVLRADRADDFIQILSSVLARPQDFESMRLAGQELVQQQHHPDRIAVQLERTYLDVRGGNCLS
jgi:glycosyltransferase involved in cell wall biosynthesis